MLPVFRKTAGTSTLAAGLAASLSETNDGKVLLVDVNLGPEEVHPFFKGKPAYPLNAALKPDGDDRLGCGESLSGYGGIPQCRGRRSSA